MQRVVEAGLARKEKFEAVAREIAEAGGSAVPNVKYSYPVAQRRPTATFDGFHLAVKQAPPE